MKAFELVGEDGHICRVHRCGSDCEIDPNTVAVLLEVKADVQRVVREMMPLADYKRWQERRNVFMHPDAYDHFISWMQDNGEPLTKRAWVN